jgi:hypothetical protein
MSQVPTEFSKLLPRISNELSKDPLYWLWVFDPTEDRVIVEHNRDRHRADHVTHQDLADKVPHPSRVHGYAYRIQGGYRITDWDHKALKDPHIMKAVRDALRNRPKPPNNHSSATLIQLRAMK